MRFSLFGRYVAACALSLFLLVPASGYAADAAGTQIGDANVTGLEATSMPIVRMKHWKESTPQERYSFLVGFTTMLELEKEWQGQTALPLRQSLTGSWVKGLSGVKLEQIASSIDKHIMTNPDDMDRSVVEYMWFTFVQPKLTEKVNDPEKVDRVTKTYKKKK